ncbi:MAG: MBL fold metallo-hydrolase [Clostridiales bacterium]|jgi:7,8-dihydropterin-6-yl-methyl-4-(beta-D-ribofuranosyl)aminobenzene 5'-phosphate synthase|nr:MBL fold metallo-hydrolase [Clostridiales bacterium]
MKVTILCDNNTRIDRYFYGEPGFSALIEEAGQSILLDTGYSEIFIRNAQLLGLELKEIDSLIFSHGHDDHTRGIGELIKYYEVTQMKKKVDLIGHEKAFEPKSIEGREIGLTLRESALEYYFRIKKVNEPFQLTENLIYLGEIPRRNDFENKITFGVTKGPDGELEPDYIIDDTSLVYKTGEGLVIVTGCCHAGICNTIEYAKEVCGDDRIVDVIGGFHLLDVDPSVMEEILAYLSKQKISAMHPCHCTDVKAKISLARVVAVEDLGVGDSFEYI